MSGFEEKVLSSLETLTNRFDGLEKRFDEMQEYMEDEFYMVRVEIQSESDKTRKMIKDLDSRVENLESVAKERWNVNDYIARLEAVETVTTKHSGQIKRNTEQIEKLEKLAATS